MAEGTATSVPVFRVYDLGLFRLYNDILTKSSFKLRKGAFS